MILSWKHAIQRAGDADHMQHSENLQLATCKQATMMQAGLQDWGTKAYQLIVLDCILYLRQMQSGRGRADIQVEGPDLRHWYVPPENLLFNSEEQLYGICAYLSLARNLTRGQGGNISNIGSS